MRMYRHTPRITAGTITVRTELREEKGIHYKAVVAEETRAAHGRKVMNYLTCWYNLCFQSYQLLHSSDCAVSMAQGIRQPVHSITSLAVPIETHSNASAEGIQKGGGGDRVVRGRD